ncbi:MAG: fibronectin type III domain-containing protein [Spirochaetales bacterium]|jgi:hypothetical protein|nr:fibronectin type III domain-containing protein [Spirochaetales bacterium]
MYKKLLSVLAFALALMVLFPSCFLEDLFDVYSEGEAPNIHDTKISRDFNQVWAIELWWDSLEGRDAYELERSEDGYAFIEIAGWTSNAYFADHGDDLSPQGLKPGSTYEYRARGHFEEWVKVDGGFGPWGGLVAVTIPNFVPPENLVVTLSTDGNSVFLNWSNVDAADDYEIYHSDDLLTGYSEIGSVTDSEFLDTSSDFSPGTTHYYKVQALNDFYGDTDFSETVSISTTPVVTAAWHDLGSVGFAAAEGEIELASMGGNLYALFADAADLDKRIKAMKHDENDTGSWSNAGTYLSLAAAGSDEVSALVSGSTLYAAYADTDVSVTSGGSPAVFVKQYSGTAWSSVGAADGLTTYDAGEFGVWGTDPVLTNGTSGPFAAYVTDSFGIINTLSYTGSGLYWDEENTDYWTTNTLSAAELGLATDITGRHIAALQSGGGLSNPTTNMYRFESGFWTPYGSEFIIGSADGFLYTHGFLCDDLNNLYLAAEKLSSGSQEACDVFISSGGAWSSLDLSAQITTPATYLDLAIVENADSSGIFAAASLQDSGSYWVELWEYSGAAWQQIGDAVSSTVGALSVDVAIDSSSRPILILAEGAGGSLRALVFRE